MRIPKISLSGEPFISEVKILPYMQNVRIDKIINFEDNWEQYAQ